MKKDLYAIRDNVAQDLIGTQMYIIFAFQTPQQAIRYFADALLDEKSVLNKHAEDYDLIELGTLQETADGPIIVSDNRQKLIITGQALLAAQQIGTPKLVKPGTE